MSDTNEQDAGAPDDFAVQRITVNRNGQDTPALAITFGNPQRRMVVSDLGLGDQFDLVELAGDNASNPTWMMMAGLAYSTQEIDGMPVMRAGRAGLKATLDRIKPDGLAAYFRAQSEKTDQPQSTEGVLDAAKTSEARPCFQGGNFPGCEWRAVSRGNGVAAVAANCRADSHWRSKGRPIQLGD